MKQYVITTGVSMIKDLNTSNNEVSFTITNDQKEALKFDFIGDAMRECVKINDCINSCIEFNKKYNYKVCSLKN